MITQDISYKALKFILNFNKKWNFIEKYWYENFKQFENTIKEANK